MDRTTAPSYSQADSLVLAFPEEIQLENGCKLYWLKDVKDNSVKLDIVWEAGSKYQQNPLSANFTSKLLLSGSDKLSAESINESLDYLGGFTSKSLDKDHGGVTLYGLTEKFAEIFEAFTTGFEAFQAPENELEKERSISLNQFRINSEKVKQICRRRFNQEIFSADSAYGAVAHENNFLELERDHILSYFNERYSTKPTFFLVGNVDDVVINKIRNWTSKFSKDADSSGVFAGEENVGSIHVEKEGALQSAVRVGRRMFDKNHPEYFHFQILNTVLGGYFGSRLMANIREDKGYTYGIGSGLAVLQDASYFFVATEVGADVRVETIQEIDNEFKRLKDELISDDELLKVKNYMLGEFLRQCDGPIAMMECFKNIHFNSLKPTYYTDFIKAVHGVESSQLQELSRKYLNLEQMVTVTAG